MKTLIASFVAGLAVALVAATFAYTRGYEAGIEDSSALSSFADAGNAYAHLHILNHKGSDELRKFLIRDLPTAVSIHRYSLAEQSFLSPVQGPLAEIKKNPQHFRGYYSRISEELSPLIESEADRSRLMADIEWLLRQPRLSLEPSQ